MCSFLNVNSHGNGLVSFLKDVTVPIVRWNRHVRQQYTDWQQNFGAHEVSVCYKYAWSYRTAGITAVRQLQQRATATGVVIKSCVLNRTPCTHLTSLIKTIDLY